MGKGRGDGSYNTGLVTTAKGGSWKRYARLGVEHALLVWKKAKSTSRQRYKEYSNDFAVNVTRSIQIQMERPVGFLQNAPLHSCLNIPQRALYD